MIKVKQLGIAGNMHNWIKNWLSKRKQRVIINGNALDWGPVTSGVPQGSVLRSVLFIIYINDIDVGLNDFIAKFADNMKIKKFVILKQRQTKPPGRLQQNLSMVWYVADEMLFNVSKCHILQVGTKNQKYDDEICSANLKTYNVSKILVFWVHQIWSSASTAKLPLVKLQECWTL